MIVSGFDSIVTAGLIEVIVVFINGGKETMTTRVYSESLKQKVWFSDTDADVDAQVQWYDLDGYKMQWKLCK